MRITCMPVVDPQLDKCVLDGDNFREYGVIGGDDWQLMGFHVINYRLGGVTPHSGGGYFSAIQYSAFMNIKGDPSVDGMNGPVSRCVFIGIHGSAIKCQALTQTHDTIVLTAVGLSLGPKLNIIDCSQSTQKYITVNNGGTSATQQTFINAQNVESSVVLGTAGTCVKAEDSKDSVVFGCTVGFDLFGSTPNGTGTAINADPAFVSALDPRLSEASPAINFSTVVQPINYDVDDEDRGSDGSTTDAGAIIFQQYTSKSKYALMTMQPSVVRSAFKHSHPASMAIAAMFNTYPAPFVCNGSSTDYVPGLAYFDDDASQLRFSYYSRYAGVWQDEPIMDNIILPSSRTPDQRFVKTRVYSGKFVVVVLAEHTATAGQLTLRLLERVGFHGGDGTCSDPNNHWAYCDRVIEGFATSVNPSLVGVAVSGAASMTYAVVYTEIGSSSAFPVCHDAAHAYLTDYIANQPMPIPILFGDYLATGGDPCVTPSSIDIAFGDADDEIVLYATLVEDFGQSYTTQHTTYTMSNLFECGFQCSWVSDTISDGGAYTPVAGMLRVEKYGSEVSFMSYVKHNGLQSIIVRQRLQCQLQNCILEWGTVCADPCGPVYANVVAWDPSTTNRQVTYADLMVSLNRARVFYIQDEITQFCEVAFDRYDTYDFTKHSAFDPTSGITHTHVGTAILDSYAALIVDAETSPGIASIRHFQVVGSCYGTSTPFLQQDPPTPLPTTSPVVAPTMSPSTSPSLPPSTAPSNAPTPYPSGSPSSSPSNNPSMAPTPYPSGSPSSSPSNNPSMAPTPYPSGSPSSSPSNNPSMAPTPYPSGSPSSSPSNNPSMAPTPYPSGSPSSSPSNNPSMVPTMHPSSAPTPSPTTSVEPVLVSGSPNGTLAVIADPLNVVAEFQTAIELGTGVHMTFVDELGIDSIPLTQTESGMTVSGNLLSVSMYSLSMGRYYRVVMSPGIVSSVAGSLPWTGSGMNFWRIITPGPYSIPRIDQVTPMPGSTVDAQPVVLHFSENVVRSPLHCDLLPPPSVLGNIIFHDLSGLQPPLLWTPSLIDGLGTRILQFTSYVQYFVGGRRYGIQVKNDSVSSVLCRLGDLDNTNVTDFSFPYNFTVNGGFPPFMNMSITQNNTFINKSTSHVVIAFNENIFWNKHGSYIIRDLTGRTLDKTMSLDDNVEYINAMSRRFIKLTLSALDDASRYLLIFGSNVFHNSASLSMEPTTLMHRTPGYRSLQVVQLLPEVGDVVEPGIVEWSVEFSENIVWYPLGGVVTLEDVGEFLPPVNMVANVTIDGVFLKISTTLEDQRVYSMSVAPTSVTSIEGFDVDKPVYGWNIATRGTGRSPFVVALNPPHLAESVGNNLTYCTWVEFNEIVTLGAPAIGNENAEEQFDGFSSNENIGGNFQFNFQFEPKKIMTLHDNTNEYDDVVLTDSSPSFDEIHTETFANGANGTISQHFTIRPSEAGWYRGNASTVCPNSTFQIVSDDRIRSCSVAVQVNFTIVSSSSPFVTMITMERMSAPYPKVSIGCNGTHALNCGSGPVSECPWVEYALDSTKSLVGGRGRLVHRGAVQFGAVSNVANAVTFNGSGYIERVGDVVFLPSFPPGELTFGANTEKFGVSVWIYPTLLSSSPLDILSWGVVSIFTMFDRVCMKWVAFSSNSIRCSTATVSLNQWTHVYAEHNGTHLSIVLNQEQRTSWFIVANELSSVTFESESEYRLYIGYCVRCERHLSHASGLWHGALARVSFFKAHAHSPCVPSMITSDSYVHSKVPMSNTLHDGRVYMMTATFANMNQIRLTITDDELRILYDDEFSHSLSHYEHYGVSVGGQVCLGAIVTKSLNHGVSVHQKRMMGTFHMRSAKLYSLLVAPQSVYNLGGNSFAGIVEYTKWNFSTGPPYHAPHITKVWPTNGGTSVPLDTTVLMMEYNEKVRFGGTSGRALVLTDLTMQHPRIVVSDSLSTVSGYGSKRLNVSLIGQSLQPGGVYAVTTNLSVATLLGGQWHGIHTNDKWIFSVNGATKPYVVQRTPHVHDVLLQANTLRQIELTFNEVVQWTGSASVSISAVVHHNHTLSKTWNAIDITPTLGGTKQLIPIALLLNDTSYSVTIGLDAFVNLQNLHYTGENFWNFTTGGLHHISVISAPSSVRSTVGFRVVAHVYDRLNASFMDPTRVSVLAYCVSVCTSPPSENVVEGTHTMITSGGWANFSSVILLKIGVYKVIVETHTSDGTVLQDSREVSVAAGPAQFVIVDVHPLNAKSMFVLTPAVARMYDGGHNQILDTMQQATVSLYTSLTNSVAQGVNMYGIHTVNISAGGTLTWNWLYIDRVGEYYLHISANTGVENQTNTFNILFGVPTHATLDQAPGGDDRRVVWHLSKQPRVSIRDVGNNVLAYVHHANYTISVRIAFNTTRNGTLVGTQDIPPNLGVGTWTDLKITEQGNYSLDFTLFENGVKVVSITSPIFTIGPPVPTTLQMNGVPPPPLRAAFPFQLTVRVYDKAGELYIEEPVSNISVSFTPGTSSESLRATAATNPPLVNFVQPVQMGEVHFPVIVVNVVGNYDFQVVYTDRPVLSIGQPIVVVPGFPSNLLLENHPLSGQALLPWSPEELPILTLYDQGGNIASNHPTPLLVSAHFVQVPDTLYTYSELNSDVIVYEGTPTLLGDTEIPMQLGVGKYTNLAIDYSGTGYIIEYRVSTRISTNATHATDGTLTVSSQPVKIELPSTSWFVADQTMIDILKILVMFSQIFGPIVFGTLAVFYSSIRYFKLGYKHNVRPELSEAFQWAGVHIVVSTLWWYQMFMLPIEENLMLRRSRAFDGFETQRIFIGCIASSNPNLEARQGYSTLQGFLAYKKSLFPKLASLVVVLSIYSYSHGLFLETWSQRFVVKRSDFLWVFLLGILPLGESLLVLLPETAIGRFLIIIVGSFIMFSLISFIFSAITPYYDHTTEKDSYLKVFLPTGRSNSAVLHQPYGPSQRDHEEILLHVEKHARSFASIASSSTMSSRLSLKPMSRMGTSGIWTSSSTLHDMNGGGTPNSSSLLSVKNGEDVSKYLPKLRRNPRPAYASIREAMKAQVNTWTLRFRAFNVGSRHVKSRRRKVKKMLKRREMEQNKNGRVKNPLFLNYIENTKKWLDFPYRLMFEQVVIYYPPQTVAENTWIQRVRSKFSHLMQWIKLVFVLVYLGVSIAFDNQLQMILVFLLLGMYMSTVVLLMPYRNPYMQSELLLASSLVVMYLFIMLFTIVENEALLIVAVIVQILVVPLYAYVTYNYHELDPFLHVKEWIKGKKKETVMKRRTSARPTRVTSNEVEDDARNDNESAQHYIRIGLIYWKMNGEHRVNRRYAYRYMVHAAKLDSSNALPVLYLGHYYRVVAKNLKKAQNFYEAAVALNSTEEDAVDCLAWMYVSSGDHERARDLYIAAELDATNTEGHAWAKRAPALDPSFVPVYADDTRFVPVVVAEQAKQARSCGIEGQQSTGFDEEDISDNSYVEGEADDDQSLAQEPESDDNLH